MWNLALQGTGYIVEDMSDRIEDISAIHSPGLSLNHDGESVKDAWKAEVPAVRQKNGDHFCHPAEAAMAFSIIFVETMVESTDDPFEVFAWQCGNRGFQVRVLKYVAEVFLRQHREAFYMALVAGKRARVARWDRCGVLISEAFDWITDAAALVNFFYKIATSSRMMQSFDTSFSWATDDEKAELLQYRDQLRLRGDVYRLQFVEAMTENQSLHPIYRVSKCGHLASRTSSETHATS